MFFLLAAVRDKEKEEEEKSPAGSDPARLENQFLFNSVRSTQGKIKSALRENFFCRNIVIYPDALLF